MLVLLTDTRRQLLFLWIGGSLIVALITLAQTLSGLLEGIESEAWIWTFVHLLPGMALLFAAAILNRNPSKVLYRATYRAVIFGMVYFLALVASTQIATPAALQRWSMQQYLAYSYLWLIPFGLLLWVILYLMYFRREEHMKPNGAIMVEYLSKKREYALRAGLTARVRAFDLLLQPEGLSQTLLYLRENTNANRDETALLSGRLVNWTQQRDLNTTSETSLQQELNRMTLAAIELINTL